MTREDLIPPATSIARHSRVYSPITVRHFSCCPLAQASNTKSYAQTLFSAVAGTGRGREQAIRRRDLWNYCSGRCQDGWTATDAVSSNTPVWEGNKTRTATAHISYRTMDARALLDATALWKLNDLGWSASYVRDLVERGRLYPSAAAPLAQFGVRPGLGTDLQLRYGRSTIPYETHSQVWALDAVGRTFAACVQ